MKKIILLGLLIILSAGNSRGYSDNSEEAISPELTYEAVTDTSAAESNLQDMNQLQNAPLNLPKGTPYTPKDRDFQLRITSLEQRIRKLEQDQRFQTDRIKVLENRINDIQRRHLR